MNSHVARRRAAAVATGLAVAVSSLVAGGLTDASHAASDRKAETAVDTTYLSDTLGLAADTHVESITYNRLNWLFNQDGQYAIVIGSPSDAFKTQIQAVDAQAKAKGVGKVYWFDPNLSGYTGLKNLDTRNPAGITSVGAASQTIFGTTWKSLLAQYLGNGYKASGVGTGTITVAADDTVVNDATAPVWDYTSTATVAPAGASDNVFFLYDKAGVTAAPVTADKIRASVNLTTTPTPPATTATLAAAAIDVVGGANVDTADPFKWWQYDNNKILADQGDAQRYGSQVLADSDDDAGWNVKQLTYPALLHLLDVKDTASANFVLLFGGTWCPNTRAVIKDVNKQAVANETTVYNFDTILDGSLVGGGNSGTNPLQVRNNANSGTTANFVPSYLYGDLVRKYLRNITTEYDPNSGNRVLYYPGGDTAVAADVVRKLQVPFVLNYQRGTGTNPSTTAVKRQWIQQNIDSSTGLPSFKEYMSQFWFTNPVNTRIGVAYTKPATGTAQWIPLSLPIPANPLTAPDSAFLTAAEASDPATTPADKTAAIAARRSLATSARANEAFGQEAINGLKTFFGGLPGAVVSTQTVTAPAVSYGTAPKVTLAVANAFGRIPAGAATLTVAGASYSANVAANQASYTLPKLAPGSYAYTVSYAKDAQILAFQKTGTLTVGKTKVTKAAGATVKAPTTKKTGTYKVSVTTPAGLAKATGKATVTIKKGSVTKKVTGTVKSGVVTVKVPKLKKGTWKVTVAYAGDARYVAAGGAGKSIAVKK